MNRELYEGDLCPECGAAAMKYPRVENCSCLISPPCSACTNNRLTCDECGFEEESVASEFKYRMLCDGITEQYQSRPSREIS